jgi:hypothetical protein
MYFSAADTPVAELEYLRQGGGADNPRDILINQLKVKAADAYLQQHAKNTSDQMHLALDQRRLARNLEAQQINWPLQLGGALLVIALVVGVRKFI